MAKTILRQVSCNHCAYGRPRGVDYSQAYCEKTKRIGSSSRARTCEKFESRLKTSSDYVSEKGFKYRSKQVDDYRTRRQWEEAGYIVKNGERGHEMHSTMMTDKTFIYYLPDEVEPISAKETVEECCASCGIRDGRYCVVMGDYIGMQDRCSEWVLKRDMEKADSEE